MIYLHVLAAEDASVAIPPLPLELREARLRDGTALEFVKTPLGTILKLPEKGRDPVDTIVVLKTGE